MKRLAVSSDCGAPCNRLPWLRLFPIQIQIHIPTPFPFLFLCLLLLLAGLTGCATPGYYLQATRGHMSLMKAREPVEQYLAEAAPNDPIAVQLKTAQAALVFAEDTLDLPADGSYQTFARTGERGVTWNVVATPAYALTPKRWCFPVAGCVPYRGYFDRDDAERFSAKMRSKGRDSAIFTATAYSTLGWFEDPILDTMLTGNEAQLVDTLFHELAHQRLYVKGAGRFNESYATFVAREGVRAWMVERGNPEAFDAWQDREAVLTEFTTLLAETRGELALLYATETEPSRLAAGKAEAFERLGTRYDALVAGPWNGRDRFRSWFEPPPNNADLALMATYTGGLCAFEGLWKKAQGDFRRFHEFAREAGEQSAEERERWLDSECADGSGSGR